MLETRMTPISTRTRRSHSSARPETRPDTRPGVRPAADEPIRRSLPSARSSRLGRSEMRLMGLATACTAVVCALLLLYLAAYARVTQLGIEQAQARALLHQSQLRNELLQAERNSLESPQRIEVAAAALGMTPRGTTPVNYVAARPAAEDTAQSGTKQGGAEMASSWDQGSNGGTTEDSRAAASFHH